MLGCQDLRKALCIIQAAMMPLFHIPTIQNPYPLFPTYRIQMMFEIRYLLPSFFRGIVCSCEHTHV